MSGFGAAGGEKYIRYGDKIYTITGFNRIYNYGIHLYNTHRLSQIHFKWVSIPLNLDSNDARTQCHAMADI